MPERGSAAGPCAAATGDRGGPGAATAAATTAAASATAACPAPKPLTEDQISRANRWSSSTTSGRWATFLRSRRIDDPEDARALLQKNADWLKRWASTQVTVEGHCDARGSAEYNLALGTRRADAVKQYLVSLGVPATRLRS